MAGGKSLHSNQHETRVMRAGGGGALVALDSFEDAPVNADTLEALEDVRANIGREADGRHAPGVGSSRRGVAWTLTLTGSARRVSSSSIHFGCLEL